MNSLTINLTATLAPIVDGPEADAGETITLKQGGTKPFIAIQFPDDNADRVPDLLDLTLHGNGLNNEQVAYFLHELAHMMLEPDSMTTEEGEAK